MPSQLSVPPNRPGPDLPDVVLVLLSVGVVTWAGATARWWTLVLLSVVATTIASSLTPAVVGVAAVAAATWIGTRRRDLPVARALVVAVGLNVAIRSDIAGFLGLSALITMTAAVIVMVSGVRRRRGGVRRRSVIAVAVARWGGRRRDARCRGRNGPGRWRLERG